MHVATYRQHYTQSLLIDISYGQWDSESCTPYEQTLSEWYKEIDGPEEICPMENDQFGDVYLQDSVGPEALGD
jgi:hypothetical protein